ncbi:MAG: response regulator [Rhodocyclaceae bacterium]|nr:response regulator [Rhodocyclaceae bacterium]
MDEARRGHADFLRTLSVLYVEDDAEVRGQLARFLERRVKRLVVADNGRLGLDAFRADHHDIVITDIKMPEMDGLQMAAHIKAASRDVPIIVITAYSDRDYLIRAIELGVNRYVTKPIDPDALVEAIYRAVEVRFQQEEIDRANRRVRDTLEQTVMAMARAIELRDPYTDGHQKRVALLAAAIAEDMGLALESIDGIRLGALIHDVGKIQVPTEILSKPGRLRDEERSIVRLHAKAGEELLGDIDFPWPIGQMVLHHHERLDGSGYPDGLKGNELTLETKIIAVADVVEAMSSHRPYRAALGLEAAIAELRQGSGHLYDSRVVDSCLRVLERQPELLKQP